MPNIDDVKYELKVETTPTQSGLERIVIQARNKKDVIEDPKFLGYPQDFKERIRTIAEKHSGVLLVCGPKGSGVTTTLHGVLRSIDCFITAMYSIGDPQGRELINLTVMEPKEGDDLEATITRVIRAEAEGLFVDPILDEETAKLYFSMQEKLMFVTEFPAPNPQMGVHQLIEWLDDPELVANGLNGIVMTKLIRKLCEKCKQVYKPNPKFLKRVGLPPETSQLYRPPVPPDPEDEEEDDEFEICKTCGGVGYYGRIPLIEFLEVTEDMKELIAQEASPQDLKKQMRREEMYTLQTDGLRLVTEGTTSLEELQRAFRKK